jgi:ABC-type Zn uptake system ZnuABC Zn-binding protein ZnuA
LNAALGEACRELREQFIKQPPELSATYQQRISQFIDQHRKVLRAEVQVNQQADSGFPPQTRFFNIVTAAPFFELRLVQTIAGLKIVFARVYPYN